MAETVQTRDLNKLVPVIYNKLVYSFLSNNPAPLNVLKGGRGSIKSSISALLSVITVLKGQNVLCMRRYSATLRDSVYADIVVAIDRLGVSKYFKCYKSPLKIVCLSTNKAIYFRGGDNPQKIKSLRVEGTTGLLWVEESNEFEGYNKIRSVIQTLNRGTRGKDERFSVICSYNPPPQKWHWVNAELGIEGADKYVLHSTYLDVHREWLGLDFIEEAERLKISNKAIYENEYLGLVVAVDGGQVYNNVYVLPPNLEYSKEKIIRGVDFGWKDPQVYSSWYIDHARKIIVCRYISYASLQSIEVLSKIIKKDNPHSFTVFCDSASPQNIAELVSYGVVGAVACKKGAGSIMAGIKYLRGYSIYFNIEEEMQELAYKEMLMYSYKYSRTEGVYSAMELEDKDNHVSDSLRYAINDILRF